MLVFTLNSKLDKKQADMIQSLFSEENEDYFMPDYKIAVDKKAFKASIEEVEYINDDTAREEEFNKLSSIGNIVNNISLTIR